MARPFHLRWAKMTLRMAAVLIVSLVALSACSAHHETAEPMTFPAHLPAGTTVMQPHPRFSVAAIDTAGNGIENATAVIDGLSVKTELSGRGKLRATATFQAPDLANGTHTVSATFVATNGRAATVKWAVVVAPSVRHTLTYTAGRGGSIEGSRTQVVASGGTEFGDFGAVNQWTEQGPGLQSADTVHVLHGPASLRLTASPSGPAYSRTNVSLYAFSGERFRLWFYAAEDPRVTSPDVQVSFMTANEAKKLHADIEPVRIVQGWNCITLTQRDFVAGPGASWSDAFSILQVGVYPSDARCSISFDSLEEDAVGRPTVAMTFDDGRQTAYDPGYTYMTSQGLAGTAYIVPTLIGRPGFMTLSELEKMNASGWDIANHTYDHVDLANLTQAQVERQLVETRDWLVSNGFPRAATDVAYPTGAYDAGVLAAMSATAMRSGRTTTGADNSVPLSNPYQIGCYFPTTLAQARADVDKAVDRQTLVVLGFHQLVASPDPTNTTQFAVSDFRTLIGYIRSRPVTVVPLSEITIGDHNNPQSTAVTAVPSVGYHFVAWSDGVISATRTDTDINADKSVTAIFGVNRN